MTSFEVDAAVAAALERGEPLYAVDAHLLRELQPDVIVTQDLCLVCAVEGSQVRQIASRLDPPPQIVALEPHSLNDSLAAIRLLAEVCGVPNRADTVVADLEHRIDRLQATTADLEKPQVLCLEWLEPPWIAGHWMPEVVELAGGHDVLGERGAPSWRATWADVAASKAEAAIVMPCGFDVERTLQEVDILKRVPEFLGLPACSSGRVFVVNGSAYFNRAGPRLIEGAELLAALLHPERFPRVNSSQAQKLAL
jgi:iron complex transport system substrate-binding protein